MDRLDQTAGCTAEAEEAKGGQMEIEGRRKKERKGKKACTKKHTNKEKKGWTLLVVSREQERNDDRAEINDKRYLQHWREKRKRKGVGLLANKK